MSAGHDMKSILVIYTGGTVGMVRDKVSGALVPLDFSQVSKHVPELDHAGIRVEAVSFDTPIDSSDVAPKHWRSIASTVMECMDRFDGFVVLHGTDTMAYSASALSFMLEGLRKPVIFTGSQLPIGIPRTDGRENLLSALMLAAHTTDGEPTVQEVAVYFGNHLFRGNRTHKESAQSLNALISPNHPSLVEAGWNSNQPPLAVATPGRSVVGSEAPRGHAHGSRMGAFVSRHAHGLVAPRLGLGRPAGLGARDVWEW